jgi:DNA-binding HxlR family transcriptional regulator
VARALDRVGERWALLVVRELLLGPKRFTDLRAGLPSASPNVLSQRLHELEDGGVVARRRLDPPASVWVYELTPWGQALEPVVLALGRWGARSPSLPAAPLSVDALVLALKTTFSGSASAAVTGTYELRLGDDRFAARVADGELSLVRGPAESPAATIEADPATFTGIVFGDVDLDAATVTGDRRAARRFLRLFVTPSPTG